MCADAAVWGRHGRSICGYSASFRSGRKAFSCHDWHSPNLDLILFRRARSINEAPELVPQTEVPLTVKTARGEVHAGKVL